MNKWARVVAFTDRFGNEQAILFVDQPTATLAIKCYGSAWSHIRSNLARMQLAAERLSALAAK